MIPVGAEEHFTGVVDLIKMRTIVWDDATQGMVFNYAPVPDELLSTAQEWREKMVSAAAEASDALMDKYLETGDLDEAEIIKGLRIRTISGEIQPMLCGSAFKNKGVQRMLDAVIELMPSPLDVPAIDGVDEKGQHAERHPSDEEPFSALAFKLMSDPYVGQLTFIRVYSGVLRKGDAVYNPVKGKKERIGRIVLMHANDRHEVDELRAGDIAACVGLKDVTTGDTLTDPNAVITLERMEFPDPVISLAIEPKTKGDQEKMGIALQRLAAEDPSFRLHTDEESGQTIISGMGELHLEIIVDRMKREFGVEANIGRPQVTYRETLRKAVKDIEGKFVRQSGGKGQYGHVVLSLEPLEPGSGFKFEDATKGGVVPREYIPSVEKGLREAMNSGVLAGYPVVDVKAILTFGSYHDVDSSEMAFRMAAILGFKEGARRADPVILEPVMHVEVETPEEYAGNIMGDLSSVVAWCRAWKSSTAARLSALTCRWQRCLDTPPRCARCRKAARPTRWSSTILRKHRAMWRMRLLLGVRSNTFTLSPMGEGLSIQRLHHFPTRHKRPGSQMVQGIQLIPVKQPASGDKRAFIGGG